MPETEGEKLARLIALTEGFKEDIQRIDRSIEKIINGDAVIAAHSLLVRMEAVEKRLNGMWSKIITLITLILAFAMLILNYFKG